MEAFEAKMSEVEMMEMDIETADSQAKELRRTMRDIKDDAMIRDA